MSIVEKAIIDEGDVKNWKCDNFEGGKDSLNINC